MRFGPRLFWFGLFGLALTWRLHGLGRSEMQITSAGPQAPEEEPLLNRPDSPLGVKTVAFVGALAGAALAAGLSWYAIDQRAERRATAFALTHGMPDHAQALITRYGCGGCHTIPGAPGADGKVGPDLGDLRERVYVGGVLRNTPDNLIQWIVEPQRFSPHTAMPVTGITEAEARDVAAYLYAR